MFTHTTLLQVKAKRKFTEITSSDLLVLEFEKRKATWKLEAEVNFDAIADAKSKAYVEFRKAMEDIEEKDHERNSRLNTAMAVKTLIKNQLAKDPNYEYLSSTHEWTKK